MEGLSETWGLIPDEAGPAVKTVVGLVNRALEKLSVGDSRLADRLATEMKTSPPFDSLPHSIAFNPEIFLAGLSLDEAQNMLSALGQFNQEKTFAAKAAIRGYITGLETPKA